MPVGGATSCTRATSSTAGTGTITHFKVTADGCTRWFRTEIAEPEPGRPYRVGHRLERGHHLQRSRRRAAVSRVQISTAWNGAGGTSSLFECAVAPKVMHAVYADELKRLGFCARKHRCASADHTLSAAIAHVGRITG